MRLVLWVSEACADFCMYWSMEQMYYGELELRTERDIVKPGVFLGGAAREERPRVHAYACFIVVASSNEDNEYIVL